MPAMHPLSHSASRAIACHFEVGAAERAAELLESESGASRDRGEVWDPGDFPPEVQFQFTNCARKEFRCAPTDEAQRRIRPSPIDRALLSLRLADLSLYSPKSHRIRVLRSQAESTDAAGRGLAARHSLCRRCFEPLSRAYVEARYSSKYTVSNDELQWLVARVKDLQTLAETILQSAPRRLKPNLRFGVLRSSGRPDEHLRRPSFCVLRSRQGAKRYG